jgi:hypothetical protein
MGRGVGPDAALAKIGTTSTLNEMWVAKYGISVDSNEEGA